MSGDLARKLRNAAKYYHERANLSDGDLTNAADLIDAIVPPPVGQVDERVREFAAFLRTRAARHTLSIDDYAKAADLLEATAARLATARQNEAEDIIACIQSTTWGGWHEIVEMIRRRIAARAGTGEQK